MTTADENMTQQLTDAINAHLASRSTTFVPNAGSSSHPNVVTYLAGSIEGHPVRFDFYDPALVEEKVHVVWAFDPRTENQIGDSSSPNGFVEALEGLDWTNLIGALTH